MKKIINSIVELNNKITSKIGIKNVKIIYAIMTILLSSGVCFLGIYKGHDIKFHVDRFKSLYLSLKEGYFPALIYPNYLEGYGYPLGIFYPDFFLYIPAVIALVLDKIPFMRIEMAYNIFIIMINMFAAYATYKCIKRITKKEFLAMVFARILVISPYFLTDAYTRSALGEHLSFAFLPLVVLGLYELTYGNYKTKGIYFTIGVLCIVLSHVLSSLLCFVFVLFFFLLNIKKYLEEKDRFKYLIIYGLLAVGMSLFYLAPMYELLKSDTYLMDFGYYVNGISFKAMPVIDLFIRIKKFSNWVPQGIGLVFLFMYIYYFLNIKKYTNKFGRDLVIVGTIFLFMSSELFPWDYINILNIMQLPWRFFQLTTVCLTIGFAVLFAEGIKDYNGLSKLVLSIKPFLTLTMCLFIYASALDFDIGFQRKLDYKLGLGEYIPAYLGGVESTEKDFAQEYTMNRGQIIESNSDNIIYSFDKDGSTLTIKYENNTDENTYLDLPLIYYYGYVSSENGVTTSAQKSDEGLVRVVPSSTSGEIVVKYGYTNVRKVGIAISGVTLIVTAYIYIRNKKKYLNA